MSSDIRSMTAELADNPASLVFLPLADALRRRGQLDAALKVALAGAARYPTLAEAHDLAARIHADRGELDLAFDAWQAAIGADPEHAGAHKGLGFLYFRAGNRSMALEHLQAAAARMPDDAGLQAGLARVRAASAGAEAPAGEGIRAAARLPFTLDESESEAAGDAIPPAGFDADVFAGLEGSADGLLLVDAQGLRLGGGLRDGGGRDVADAVAAELAGVSREAARAARLLELGDWESLAVECGGRNFHLAAPTAETVLLAARDGGTPAGRLALLADRAARVARGWLEQVS